MSSILRICSISNWKNPVTSKLFRINKLSDQSTRFNSIKIRRFEGTGKDQVGMLKDKVPPSYQLIYRAPMETYLKVAKHISTATATVITCTAAYILSSSQFANSNFSNMETMGLVSHQDDIYYFVTGFVVITLLIRLFIAKYPLRIYRNADRYIAIYDGQLSLQTSQHHFRVGDVKELYSSINPWNGSTYKLGKRTTLLLTKYFKTPSEYNKMLGYN